MRFSLIRLWRERRLRRAFEPLRVRLQEELSQALAYRCEVVPASGKGGYDRLFYVEKGGRRMAMMRVKNQQAGEPTPVVTEGLRRALTADERLAHEWSAYAALSTQNLSPKPLWRTEAAIVCSYHPFARVAACLKADGAQVWQLLPRVCALVRAMHAMQIVHMDLNLGNILVDPQSDQMMLIDFEYAPVAGLSFADACRCDYLRVINDFLRPRRGGRELQKDFTRFVTLLQHEVPATLAGGSDRPLCAHFPHIAREARSRQAMEALLGVR